MTKRNLVWMALVVVGLVVGWLIGGWVVGVLTALAVLIASEVVERTRRRRIATAAGTEVPSVRNAITSRRTSRRTKRR